MTMQWIFRGRCWKFGDDVGIDGDMMPLRFALTRELDPQVLALNFSRQNELADGLTHGMYLLLGELLAGMPLSRGFRYLGIFLGIHFIAVAVPATEPAAKEWSPPTTNGQHPSRMAAAVRPARSRHTAVMATPN